MNRWYVLLVEPQQEGIAHAGLIARGWKAYAPTFAKRQCYRKATSERPGVQRIVTRPLFPGYGFIAMEEGREEWERVRGVPGVRKFLNIDGEPAVLPEAAVMAIRAKEEMEEQKFIRAKLGKRDFPYKTGDSVVMVAGPFAEQLAIVETLDDKGRIRLLMSLFGRTSRVDVDASEIRAA